MYELVIFDCDGVLVDSEAISNNVLARMLTREGLPTTLREARRDYQGLLLADIRRQAEAKLGRQLPAGWLGAYERHAARGMSLVMPRVRLCRVGRSGCRFSLLGWGWWARDCRHNHRLARKASRLSGAR
jgi:hypothetical protein